MTNDNKYIYSTDTDSLMGISRDLLTMLIVIYPLYVPSPSKFTL